MKDQQFYATAAQVIPIFVLALAFEFRFFEPRDETVAEALLLVSLLVALAGGEILALVALLTEDAERFTKPMVLFGLVWGGIGLFVPLFVPRMRVLAQELTERWVRAIRIGWPLVLLAVVLATLITRSDAVIPGAIFVLWMSLVCVWFFISSAQDAGALRAKKRDREKRAEQAEASAPPGRVPNRVPNGQGSDETERT